MYSSKHRNIYELFLYNNYEFIFTFAYKLVKMGRKPSNDPKKGVSIRIRGTLKEKLEKMAKDQKRPIQYFCEEAIEEKYGEPVKE